MALLKNKFVNEHEKNGLKNRIQTCKKKGEQRHLSFRTGCDPVMSGLGRRFKLILYLYSRVGLLACKPQGTKVKS